MASESLTGHDFYGNLFLGRWRMEMDLPERRIEDDGKVARQEFSFDGCGRLGGAFGSWPGGGVVGTERTGGLKDMGRRNIGPTSK
jgi:hypothetical protein